MAKYTCVDDTLRCFEWMENYRKLADPATINFLKMNLRFLKVFLISAEKLPTEDTSPKDLISNVQVWVQNAGKAIQSLCANAVEESKVTEVIEPELRYAYFRSLKLSLPSQMKANIPMVVAIGFLCCFHSDLKEILSPKAYLMASARDQVCNLSEELNFVIAFLRDVRKMDDSKSAKDLLAHTKAMTTKTAHVIHLLLVNSLGLIDFLLGIINVVLDNKNDSIAFVGHQLEIVKTELVSLRSLLRVNDLKTDITDVVHEAKHAIGSLIIRESPCWHCMLQLSNVIIKIQSVNNKVASRFVSDQILEIGVGTSAQNSDSSSEVHMPPVKSEIETKATEV
ncbi:hypothetical protein FXO37_22547 [Capsicum annuum]|nr:hypothetical protein FXO37_22547 [Capsicum annuum]